MSIIRKFYSIQDVPMSLYNAPYNLISAALSNSMEELPPTEGQKPAAVAMILNRNSVGLDMLFIERAWHQGDPWSGNIGFPGGRRDPSDETLRHTAERETMEEIGVDLAQASCLGRLPDIVGHNLPVRVSCFVYGVHNLLQPGLSSEVRDVFWYSLSELSSPVRQVNALVKFGDRVIEAPAIDLGLPEKPVLWGITYRLVGHFRQIMESGESGKILSELLL